MLGRCLLSGLPIRASSGVLVARRDSVGAPMVSVEGSSVIGFSPQGARCDVSGVGLLSGSAEWALLSYVKCQRRPQAINETTIRHLHGFG